MYKKLAYTHYPLNLPLHNYTKPKPQRWQSLDFIHYSLFWACWTSGLGWFEDQSCVCFCDCVGVIVITLISDNQHRWIIQSSLHMFACRAASQTTTFVVSPEIVIHSNHIVSLSIWHNNHSLTTRERVI